MPCETIFAKHQLGRRRHQAGPQARVVPRGPPSTPAELVQPPAGLRKYAAGRKEYQHVRTEPPANRRVVFPASRRTGVPDARFSWAMLTEPGEIQAAKSHLAA